MLLKLSPLLCLFLISSVSWASSESPPKEEPAGGAHQKAETPAWVELQNKIQTLHGKIGVADASLKKLLEEKRHIPAHSPKIKDVAAEIVKTHQELAHMLEEYGKLNTILKFRYPERGLKDDQALKYELKPLDDLEEEVGVDAKLSRSMRMLRQQYGSNQSESQAAADQKTLSGQTATSARAPASKLHKNSGKELPINEAPPIILQK